MEHAQGFTPRFDQDSPWELVFRFAVAEREYWDEHVRDPALRLIALWSKSQSSQPGGGGPRRCRRRGTEEEAEEAEEPAREAQGAVGEGSRWCPGHPGSSTDHGGYVRAAS